ncbi:MAG: FAD-dependent oxidoreductase [Selenomonadaceae bacterium]|nr:FAD-dependent oxidoreductase [Selenomonadaceae bacterium]
MKVVIVGGVAGGASAAARLRRLDEGAEIVIFERTGFVSYANCGLPYFIGGVIQDRSELLLKTPESFWSRFHITVKVSTEVLSVNRAAKTVTVKNLITGEEWAEPYDKLILSPGAKAVLPPLPGIDSDRIFTLRTVEDTFRIHDFIAANQPKSAVVIGGGFIGLEMAENLSDKGLAVTILELQSQLMTTFDSDMASFIHNRLRQAGIALRLNTGAAGFEDRDGKIVTLLKDNTGIAADMVIMAAGVAPDSSLAVNAGLKTGIRGSICVDDHMRTSDEDIYAVGDAVQVKHFVTGADALISLAGPANKQGRIAADNICGIDSTYSGSLGSSVIKIFDMTAASTGLTERAARAAGLDCESVVLGPMSHAVYYPGAKALTMKVVFERGTLRILGAQIIGAEGADKRLDVIATAIQAEMKADRLKNLDLAYAPPYSSAKDPVNMAGFIIENISKGLMKQYHAEDVDSLPRDGSVTLLDTRTVEEYGRSHADGYINIPLDELRERLSEMDKTKPVYVMCHSGLRSYIACRILSENGYDSYNFSGGYRFYESVCNEKLANDNLYPCGMEK